MIRVALYLIHEGADATEIGEFFVAGLPQVGNDINQWRVVHVDLMGIHPESLHGKGIARGVAPLSLTARIFVEPSQGGYFR